ncbi:LytTR family DNA-binding domain-containing protein [Novosphingobium sp. ZW T3_23]|uniref:LytTR family DNA-binding domain-containing protein n=1 Tax=Novosphingobium sp. ZW T3_23 TaxID=3378084 RepID=UPI003854DB32
MNWARRGLLELWAMVMLAAVVGFLGPFGTYLEADFPTRVWNWFAHLMGAYVLVRPTIWFLAVLADATAIPRGALICWGVLLASFPLALVWEWGASMFFQALGGFAGLLPFAILSAAAILAVVVAAKRIDGELANRKHAPVRPTVSEDRAPSPAPEIAGVPPVEDREEVRPRLLARLGPAFEGPILALQSEDHYVRVHGVRGSELLLMRLRDAIPEMADCPGYQVHRGWWVAESAVSGMETNGRNRTIVLINGEKAPVARDSVAALERAGFLPPAR